MKFTMTVGEGIPAGGYSAEFIGVEEFENEYGPGVRLKWKVNDGEHAGAEPSAMCSQKLSAKSKLHKFVKALKGGEIAAGEEIDLQTYVGVRGLIVVVESDNGATYVDSFLRHQ
ncbi:MAG: hypothetical protein ABGZ35_26160 [Planctomycetaceae bacterium]